MPAKIKCLIVDDEPAAHFVLINYISNVDTLELSGQCYNVVEAINFLHKKNVDLVFLDIKMPELSGFDFLKALASPPGIIFTTAYSEHALQSYEYGAIDYLMKPVEFPRFLKSISRFLSYHSSGIQSVQGNGTADSQSVDIKVDGELTTIQLDDIIYTQSLGNYVKIITTQRTLVCSITTAELEKRLPPDRFIRIHKSHLVPLSRIETNMHTSVIVGGKELPVGITYRRKLSETIK